MSNYSDKAILEAGWFTGVNWSNSFMIVDEFTGEDLMSHELGSILKCKELTTERADEFITISEDLMLRESWGHMNRAVLVQGADHING